MKRREEDEKSTPEKVGDKPLWDKAKGVGKAAFNWTLRYPVALIISFLVIVVASILLFTGVGGSDRFNWGGLIGTLFGKKKKGSASKKHQKANAIPEDRVDEKGDPLPKDEPDDKGYVQREVEVLDRSSNPFRDKTVIKIGKDGKKIDLPEGLKDTDVEKVIEIEPEVYEVVENKRPKERVTKQDLDLLK